METATKEWKGIRPADGFGWGLRPGNIVSYPMRRGSNLYMVDAVVVSAEDWSVPLLIRPLQERHGNRVKLRTTTRLIKFDQKSNRLTLMPHLKAVKTSTVYEIVER